MGAVFRAVDTRSGQEVALKLLTAQDERARRRLALEARALTQLRHRSVVSLLDAGEDRGRAWLALELVRGRSLQERLDREGPLPPREAARLLQSVAAGLTHAHRQGVLHRDLKPSNVLLPDGGGEAKLTDFGLAGFEFELSQSRLTKSGTFMGSPGYWSPEQAAGQASAVGAATDVYGLGALLYAALTGRAPIAGESLQELLVATATLRPAAPGVDPVLDALALRCLEKGPAERPPTVDAVARELARYLAGVVAPRRRGGVVVPAIAAIAALAVAGVVLAWWGQAPAAPLPPVVATGTVTEVDARAPIASLPRGVVPGAREGELVNEKDGSVLVRVPAMSFRMGSEAGDPDERPIHDVRLMPYFIGKHEVTWAQYRAFCQARAGRPPSNVIDHRGQFEAPDQHPVFNVSWADAQAYCQWAGLRLPTEAEWEGAARGEDGRSFPWGNEQPGANRCSLGTGESADYRDSRDGFPFTAPVGSFPEGASPFGAQDMAGNVLEWTQDWYGGYPAEPAVDPSGPTVGDQRVLRGGSWRRTAQGVRAPLRNRYPPTTRHDFIGFRVARSSQD